MKSGSMFFNQHSLLVEAASHLTPQVKTSLSPLSDTTTSPATCDWPAAIDLARLLHAAWEKG